MSKPSSIVKVISGAALAGALTLASIAGGGAGAEEPVYVLIGTPPFQAGDGDVDGRDFLVWQRDGSPSAGDDAPTEEVAFYYNKIAFQFAATSDGAR